MTYYIKKCNRQELGSVGVDGTPKRGRYLFTSKNQRILSFFPPLTTTQKNDSSLLAIIPLYSGIKTYCNFVYHNDKYHNSNASHPRNEHRIYLNKTIENNLLLFKADDILVFKQDTIEIQDNEFQTIYYLEHLNDKNSPLFKNCNEILKNSNINGGYAIFEGSFPEIESKIEFIKSCGQSQVIIENSVTDRILKNTDTDISDLFNAISFRDFVMVGYKNLCAVTRTALKYNSFTNLEAAHIRPKSHGGKFLPNNGIALTRDLHWAFDKGFFTISDDMRVIVHKSVESEYLQSFNNSEVYISNISFFAPDLASLKYHQENIFGLFQYSGRLWELII